MIEFEPGELTAIAYRDNREVARHAVRTPGQPSNLRVDIDLAGVPLTADGVDAVFVHAYVIDQHGSVKKA